MSNIVFSFALFQIIYEEWECWILQNDFLAFIEIITLTIDAVCLWIGDTVIGWLWMFERMHGSVSIFKGSY